MLTSLATRHPGAAFVYAFGSIPDGMPTLMLENSPADTRHALNPQRWLQEHGNVLFRYALARVRDRSTAEDLVQETFLAALRSQGGYAGRSAEQTWLVGILRHKIVDHYRRRREQSLPEESEGEAQNDLIDRLFDRSGHWVQPPKAWKDPRASLQQAEFFEVLRACLQALPGRHGEVFALYQLEQHSSDRVCEDLGISASNFGVIMYRARLRLRQCLEVNWFNAG